MKFKFLTITTLSVIVLPSIALISCSNNPLTTDEINEQKFLVNEAAEKKSSPVISLKKNTNINEIKENLINFKNFNKGDLLYEILNFEIPLVNAIDNNVNVKVSSKLDPEISQTYSFKISSSIVPNSFVVEPMTKESFDEEVNKVYFKDQLLSDLINDISIRVKQSSYNLDITKKLKDEGETVASSIFTNPLLKLEFEERFHKIISPVVINKLNNESLQKNLKIQVTNIIPNIHSLPNIEGLVNLDIIFGKDSIYSLAQFPITTFSTEYYDLENKLTVLLSEDIVPTLLIGEVSPIKIKDLYNNLSVFIPDELDPNKEFLIGPDSSIIIPPGSNDTFEIVIEIFSEKYSDTIKGTYKIAISKLINYSSGRIDFTTSVKTLVIPYKRNERK